MARRPVGITPISPQDSKNVLPDSVLDRGCRPFDRYRLGVSKILARTQFDVDLGVTSRVSEFAQGTSFELTHTFLGHTHFGTDFF